MNRTLFILILFVLSCSKIEPDLSNPLDPDNPVYEPPSVQLMTKFDEGDTLYAEDVTLNWESSEIVEKLVYSLEGNNGHNYTDSTTADSITFIDLFEGSYIFSIYGEDGSGVLSDVDSVSFSIDAIQSKTIAINPRYGRLSGYGLENTFQVWALEFTEGFSAGELTITTNPSDISIETISMYTVLDTDNSVHFIDEISPGKYKVSFGVWGDPPPEITGDQGLISIDYTPLRENSTTTVTISGTLKNQNNQEIIDIIFLNGLLELP